MEFRVFSFFPLERIFLSFSLVKDPNSVLTQSSRVTDPCSKESEIQQPTENHCSPQKTEEHTQTAKSALPQPLQSKAEPVKGTHVQLEPKAKPATPGSLFSASINIRPMCAVLKLHIS